MVDGAMKQQAVDKFCEKKLSFIFPIEGSNIKFASPTFGKFLPIIIFIIYLFKAKEKN